MLLKLQTFSKSHDECSGNTKVAENKIISNDPQRSKTHKEYWRIIRAFKNVIGSSPCHRHLRRCSSEMIALVVIFWLISIAKSCSSSNEKSLNFHTFCCLSSKQNSPHELRSPHSCLRPPSVRLSSYRLYASVP